MHAAVVGSTHVIGTYGRRPQNINQVANQYEQRLLRQRKAILEIEMNNNKDVRSGC